MTEKSHLFYSTSTKMPSNFRLAFSSVEQFDAKKNLSKKEISSSDIVWLHLSSASTVAQQVTEIRKRFATAPLVVMSDLPNDLEALAAFSVAARGYCNTHAGVEVLLNIASVVAQGGIWIGESIMQRLLAAPMPVLDAKSSTVDAWSEVLTMREREVAKAVAAGASNKEIALQMAITERTVKAHVGAVLEKLHLKSRLQLALVVKS